MDAAETTRNRKQAAAAAAAALVTAGMAVGLGHGSTAVAVVPVVAERARRGELAGTVFVPAARFMADALRRHGLPVVGLDDVAVLDLAIDGADEIAPNLDCVKGGGGALLYEKIVAQAARRFVLVADDAKLSPVLGSRHAVPVEVTPFALAPTLNFLAAVGGRPTLRLRPDGDPMRTQRGNVICDCAFGPMADPAGQIQIHPRRRLGPQAQLDPDPPRAKRLDHGAGAGHQPVGIAEKCRAGPGLDHLAHRAAAIEVEICVSGLGQGGGGPLQIVRLRAEKLHHQRSIGRAGVEQATGIARIVEKTLGADHLGDGDHRPEFAAQQAKRQIGKTGQRGQPGGVGSNGRVRHGARVFLPVS